MSLYPIIALISWPFLTVLFAHRVMEVNEHSDDAGIRFMSWIVAALAAGIGAGFWPITVTGTLGVLIAQGILRRTHVIQGKGGEEDRED